jgi:hypothetical protein
MNPIQTAIVIFAPWLNFNGYSLKKSSARSLFNKQALRGGHILFFPPFLNPL